jgi:hypothetical protein
MLRHRFTRSAVAGKMDGATFGPVRKNKQAEQKSACFCSLFALLMNR